MYTKKIEVIKCVGLHSGFNHNPEYLILIRRMYIQVVSIDGYVEHISKTDNYRWHETFQLDGFPWDSVDEAVKLFEKNK